MINRKEFISRIFKKQSPDKEGDVFLRNEPFSNIEPCPKADYNHVPELTREMVYYEAMKIGIDPSNFSHKELRARVMKELSGKK